MIDESPQLHAAVWDIFKEVSNKRHTEAYEQLLADDSVRVEFYERFSQFARKFAVALSSASFLDETPEARVDKYKADLQFSKVSVLRCGSGTLRQSTSQNTNLRLKNYSTPISQRTVFSGSLVRRTFSTRKHGSKQLRKPTVTQQKRT